CIRNIDMGFSIHSPNDQPLFVLYSSYVGQVFQTLPFSGEFRCLVPKLPLAGGRYRVGARVTVSNEDADWPRDGVGYLNVESADFYGTGSKGIDRSDCFLIAGEWKVEGIKTITGESKALI
ncbi:MAG: hypothetical protein ACRENZ_11140, partial [Thermodesulfobacteriota bacterium]